MFLKIILGITNIIVTLAFYYVTTTAIEKRKNHYFGIKINIDEKETLFNVVKKYKKHNKSLLYPLLFLTIISFFYKNSSYILLTHVVIFMFSFFGFYGGMMKYTMKFDDLILDDDDIMSKLEVKKTRKIDLYLSNKADDYKFTSILYNLCFPIIITAYMMIRMVNIGDINSIEYSYQMVYIVIIIVNIVLMLTSIIVSQYIKNSRQVAYTENPEENVAINFSIKNTAINTTYLIHNINVIANFLFALTLIKSTSFSIAILIISGILTLFLLFSAYKKFSPLGSMDESHFGNWVYGIFYYNKADRRLMVNQRFGIGTTINIAKPMGKLIGSVAVLTIIICYSMIVYFVIGNDMIPSKLIISNDMIHITSFSYSTSISYDEVNRIELIHQEKIAILFKTNGIGNERYRRGYYDVKDLGNCFVCTYNYSDNVILIKAKEQNILYSAQTSEETEAIYHKLFHQMSLKK